MKTRPRRRTLIHDGSGSGSFYGYIGDLRNAFDPHSILLKSWHQLLLGCLLYEAFFLPFAVTFAADDALPSSTSAFRAFYAAEVLFCADFYVKLNTGFYEAGNIHRDKRRARAKYLTSFGFFLDLLAIAPLSIMLPLTNVHWVSSGTCWPAWLEALKVLRFRRIPSYLTNLDDVYSKRFRSLKIFKVLVVTTFVAHVAACGRFAFGRSKSASDPWLPFTPLENDSLTTQYVQALFWSVGLLTGAFDGALPRFNTEFAFTLTVALLGFVLFIYACSTLFMLSKSESNQTELAQARINQLRHLLTFHRVPESLQVQAVEYLKRHHTDAESNDREVVKLLCPSITKDIQVELLKDMVGRIPLFRGCNQQFIVALTSLLEMTCFPAHVTLFEAGDNGDYMYLVNSGVLHILVNGVKVRELRQGSFFGEVSVFSKRPRSAAVVTTSYCTLYRLSRFHTERVLEGYPDYASQIAATIDDMIDEREARQSQKSRGGGDEYMLMTLFQLSTKLPVKRKRPSLRDRAKIVARASLKRSKSTLVLSASRHSEYDGGNISMNENRAINFRPTPIELPPTAIARKPSGKLIRSHSAYARRVSSGVGWWTQRTTSIKSSAGTRPDTMQGFYDNLSRRQPSSAFQYCVALVLMVLGFLSMAVTVDYVQKRITASAFEQKEFLATRTRVQRFINSRAAPPEVHQRVKSFLEFWWSSHRGAIAGDLLNELPEAIKRPVLRSMCQPALRTLSLLADVRPSLDSLEQIFIDNARFILYGQGEIIYRQGDYASGLYFLLEGELIVIVNAGMPRTIVKGGFIGTAALNLSETSVSYDERVTAASGCILIFVSREHLNGMHKVFPTFSMALRALEKRLEGAKLARAQQDYSSRERSFSGGARPMPDLKKKVTLEVKVLRYVGLEDIIFDPDESSAEIWELWMFCLTIALYLKVIDDITSEVDTDEVVGSEVIAVLIEIFFMLDFFFRSRLGYYDFGNKIMDVEVIRKKFFHSHECFCDALALIPLYAVNWMLGSSRRELLTVNKLLRLVRGAGMFSILENKHLNRTLQLRLAKVVLVSLMVTHLFGCVWFNFNDPLSSKRNPWAPGQSLTSADEQLQYSASLFWSFGLMSNSYAGELPKTVAQCCFTVVVLLTGAFLFAFVVGNISDVVELIDANSRDFNGKLSSLRLLLAHFHLPPAIEEQLKTYFFFQRYHTITQEYLLERCLPPSLLTEIRLVHLQPMIAKVGFLAGMEGSVTRMLVSQFVQALAVKNQFVFHLGEEGSDMFFVFTGIIEVLVPLETLYRRQSHDAKLNALGSPPSRSSFHTYFTTMDPSKLQAENQLKKVNELTSGSYFGEVALFTSKPRSAHARCKTSCVLYKLSRRSLELVFERYPDWKRKVLKIVNIQQEQQHLRNLYMEEQMDIAAKASKSMLNHADILGDATNVGATNRSGSSSTGSNTDRVSSSLKRGMRKPSTRPIGTMSSLKSAGNFFSSYKAQRSVAVETPITLQMTRQKNSVLWVDMLLQCSEAQSPFHVQWLKIIAFGTIYMALIVPYRNSYDALERLSPLPIAARVVELSCEVLFGWDIWVHWNLKDGLESLELYESKQRDAYQKQRLWIDVISAIPIDHFLSDFCQSPLLGLNRCLKLVNFPHYMREINRRSVAYEKNRLCTLWILLFVLMHWCACVYFSLASASEAGDDEEVWDNWSPPRSVMTISWADPSLDLLMLRFLRGIFFASTAFVKKGKVFEPTTYSEYTFTLFVDFVGLVTMAYMIGEMANLYVSYISNEVEFRKNHIAVDLYLERWHITGKLRARSHAFLSSLWSSHRGVNYQAIFDEIPQVIRTESVMHIAYLPLRVFINNVFRPFATTHPHDRDVDAITRTLAQHLKYEGYPRDECVLVEGSVSKEMYFVVKGHLMSTTTTGGSEVASNSSQQSGLHYKKGDYFGDQGLLGYSVGVSTVKTISACDLLSLSSETLLEVILSRPIFQTALSLAVEAYRELCTRTRQTEATKKEEDWGAVLFRILNTRKQQWIDEALQYTAGLDSDPMNEPWTVSCLKPGQEVGMVAISSPHTCVKVFENLLRLIATRGLLDMENLQQSAAQFQDMLPIMATDLAAHRSTNMSATERSDSSKLSNKLSYIH
ncbi:hypothetical protein PF002_g15014 [Phytophthora fragariae]|uniref:Cyclic nucleotide-binding domain-containing protein n=1 Tax=Phytophthora fragariae TaxID=53985 RepID=A0A6A3YTQ0_9STRA|nr:hypothetical protein PF002_g15014 [Phytophthora fragariae]